MHTQPQQYGYYPPFQPQPQQYGFQGAQQPFQQVVYSNRKLQHINCVIPATQDLGGLYIGDTISTLKTEYLLDNKIEAILCLNAQAAKNVQITRFHLDFKYMEIQDHVDYPINLHFESAYDYIESKLKSKKNVLVQCHGGVSRSATIVCAYLIKKKSWIPEQALNFLKERRHRAKPNAGFWQKLNEYWKSLNQGKFKEEQIKFKSPTKEVRKQRERFESPVKDKIKEQERQQSKRKELEKTAAHSEKDIGAPMKSPQKNNHVTSFTEKKKSIFSSPCPERKQRFSESVSKCQTPYQYFKSQQSPQIRKPSNPSTDLFQSTMPLPNPQPQQYQQAQQYPQYSQYQPQSQQPMYPIPQQSLQNWQARPQQVYTYVNQHPYHQSHSNFYSLNHQDNYLRQSRGF